ncbi:MAG TPA: dihydrofolate reductase [Spongiibacteraceae bacterium]|jgi:dihydrofolate reductase
MKKTKASVALILAVAQNGIIGKDNGLPWRIPAEMKYFMAKTLGKPVIMGRKTFETLKAPLPRRTNIVITHDKNYAREGIVVAHTLDEALQQADAIAQRDGVDEIMVAGGAEIYRLALPDADTLYYTRVNVNAEGDAQFDAIDWSQWRLESQEDFPAQDAITPGYTLMRWRRA